MAEGIEGPGDTRAARLHRLRELLEALPSGTEDPLELPRLYRYASTELARAEARPGDPWAEADLRRLVARAHQRLFGAVREVRRGLAAGAARFFLVDSPRAVRAERRLLIALFAVFYGLALAAFLGVRADLELAYALQGEAAVDAQIEQLRALAPGEAWRGNFTFGLRESGTTAGWILANNIRVALLFFASGLVPPLFAWILLSNAVMLGTYLGVAAHWGQAGSITSIIACHGVIELQMIGLAGAAGLVLARAWIAPGPWSREHAMALESRRAWALASPAIPYLVLAGLIEGFVSPHAGLAGRLATAAATGLLLVAWAARGRGAREARPAAFQASSASSGRL